MAKIKKIKNEAELVKEAIRVGVKYCESREGIKFDESHSFDLKVEFIYRILCRDKLLQALPEIQVSQKAMRHKLAIWISKQLPDDHPLLK